MKNLLAKLFNKQTATTNKGATEVKYYVTYIRKGCINYLYDSRAKKPAYHIDAILTIGQPCQIALFDSYDEAKKSANNCGYTATVRKTTIKY
jgi:hypothetical protein